MMSDVQAVVFEEVGFAYAKNAPVLDNINLTIPRGQFIGIAGCNGAGKSTMLRLINGLLRPGSGKVLLLGNDTKQLSVAQAANYVGTVFQNPNHQLFLETVEAEIAYGLDNRGLDTAERNVRIDAALVATGLDALRSTFPRALSFGLRQRVALASVLALQPDILLLDEPTTGLDHHETERLMGILFDQQAKGRTVILVTHDLELQMEYAQRVLLMGQGRILQDGLPQHVFSCHETLLEAALLPPDMTRLTYGLQEFGVRTTCSIQETADQVLKMITGEGGQRIAG